MITAVGCLFVVNYSKDFKALDTIDFWVGTFLLFVLATIQVIIFGWVLGADKGFAEMHKGAEFRLPGFVNLTADEQYDRPKCVGVSAKTLHGLD